MKFEVRKLLLALGASLTLAACGGGTDDGYDIGDGGSGITQPQAIIQASLDGNVLQQGGSVGLGRVIKLDAGSSRGGVIGYQWMVTRAPAGSQAALKDASSAVASLVPDVPGDYQVSLSVGNGAGNAAATLEFVAVSTDPVAVVPASVDALVGTVQVDGSGSVPPEGGAKNKLGYAWRLVGVPPESSLRELSATEAARSVARFQADVEGEYRLALSVSYEGKVSAPATIRVQVVKPYAKPVAVVAPVTGPVLRGREIEVDGSGSSASSGGALQYRWEVSGPFLLNGTPAAPVVMATNGPKLRFTPKAVGSYTVALQVFDGYGIHSSQTSVTVAKPENEPNTPPVAAINLLQYNPSAQAERGLKLELNGRDSYDIDESGNSGLTYEWKLLSAPETFDLAATEHDLNVRYAHFKPTVDGNYEFEFRVKDAQGAWSQTVRQVYSVANGANRRPTADIKVASGNNNTNVGATVTLDASRSSDPDTNELTYAWTLLDRPDGSSAALQGTGIRSSFVADKAGPYVVQLVVTDSKGIASPVVKTTVFAKARNHAPQVRPMLGGTTYGNQGGIIYDAEQPLLIGKHQIGRPYQQNIDFQGNTKTYVLDHWNSFALASNAYDPDGDAMTYLWTLVSSPASSSIGTSVSYCPVGGQWSFATKGEFDTWLDSLTKLAAWDCRDLRLAPTVDGTYELELMVSDGADISGPFKLSMYAASRANYPSLLLEDMLRGTGSQSYDTDDLLSWIRASEITPRQYVFPLDYQQKSSFPIWLHEVVLSGETVLKTYRLSAVASDYTITDLQASSVDAEVVPRFIGLQNGQRIRKGEVVEFQLAFKSPANLPERGSQALRDISDGLNWFFRVEEKPDWTFKYTPYIY